jgi:glycosyltransferase involved in cell wall biosynthesis
MNFGKGKAIQTALTKCNGDYLVIQDADLEYDPNHYPELLEPLLKNEADVVYGSRYLESKPKSGGPIFQYVANRVLTSLSNLVTGFSLTDMETGFKIFTKEVYQQLRLSDLGFGIEPEINSKLSRMSGIRLVEVPISYTGRSYKEGKKIGWKDGIMAIFFIFKYRYFDS